MSANERVEIENHKDTESGCRSFFGMASIRETFGKMSAK
jgi:hypothetical protein